MQEKHPIVFRDALLERTLLSEHLRQRAGECRCHRRVRPADIGRSAFRLRRALNELIAWREMGDDSRLTPAALWLCDNARLLEEACLTVRVQLRHAPLLPASSRIPGIQILIRESIAHSDARIDEDALKEAAIAWQKTRALTEDELNLLPLMAQRGLLQLLSALAVECVENQRAREQAQQNPDPSSSCASPAYWESLLLLLQEKQDAAALSRADERLAQLGTTAAEIVSLSHEEQARDRLWVGNAISSLRALSALEWVKPLESLSAVEAVFSEDPVYEQMDHDTRSRYRRRVSRLAHRFNMPEKVAALRCLELSRQGDSELTRHVGYYLLDDGQPSLWQALGRAPFFLRAGRFLSVHASLFYLLFLTLGVSACGLALWLLGLRSVFLLPALLVAGDAFRQLTALAVHRFLPPRPLPKIAPESLGDEQVLVTVPVLLTSPKQALEMVRHLSVLRLANPQSKISYMLLADFMDAASPELPEDAAIVEAAQEAVHALNQVWGGGFYYLHRRREKNAREGKWMGWERKRGALHTLNHLLLTGELNAPAACCTFDPQAVKDAFPIVITLDADTQLPPGSALSLAGILAHPLNRPCVHRGKRRGICVVQPRMETAPATMKTHITRIFSGGDGVDPYLTAFSDVYQNLCGKGSFAGKGVYHVQAFSEAMKGRIRENTILSHDLLEGALASSSMACDMTLFDSQPAAFQGWMKRQHRWTRGDWQLLPWLFPYVRGEKGWMRNPLSLLNLHKIYDNLRRSLVPAAALTLIVFGAFSAQPLTLWGGALLPFLLSFLPPHPKALKCAFFHLALLPCEAVNQLDAIGRTLFRLFISRRRLLEWVPSAEAERLSQNSPVRLWPCWLSSIVLLFAFGLTGEVFALPLAFLWAFALKARDYLNAPCQTQTPLSSDQRAFLLDAAKKTLRFFDDTVTPASHFLPPDNLQLDPPRGTALRTSPTNIGMYLLSCVSACELGLLDADSAARRMERTVQTLERMEKWNGHLFNWYHPGTLDVLEPRYVSSVDSGNLAACLTLCAQALRARLEEVDSALRSLPRRLDALSEAMDFSCLYDEQRGLFLIGLNVQTGQGGDSHYDLLASEARLLSFLAITRRAVPPRHWQRLGRSMSRAGGGVLLSWSGTMFEYLLPALFLPSVPGTLLGDTCLRAAQIQRREGGEGFWGISESGFYAFDLGLSYQYRAFGLSQLSLRSQRQEKVIAPYAAALALPFLPREACDNLQAMADAGWMGDLGFFEAADFCADRLAPHCPYRLVRSHMAHHQGMILASICNLLTDGALWRTFASLPQVEAFSLLLQERRPSRRMLRRSARLRRPALPSAPSQAPLLRRADPRISPPQVHLLGGHGASMLVTARGDGYLMNRGLMLTRWHPGETYPSGPQMYIRCGTEAPVRLLSPDPGREMYFDRGCMILRRSLDGLEVEMTCFISPLDGAAVTLLRLYAHRETEVEAVSFLELCLASQSAQEAHPVFQGLAVQTAAPAPGLITARRRPREQEERHPFFLHAVSAPREARVTFETSRSAFLGRDADSMNHPALLDRPAENGKAGDVLDPCASLRVSLAFHGGQSATLVYVSALEDDEHGVQTLVQRYRSASETQRLLDMAKTQDDVYARYYGLTPPLLLSARILSSYLTYPSSRSLPISTARSALWPMGISGDLPVICAVVGHERQLPLARDLLRLHAYLKELGLHCDLVIVNTQPQAYHRPVRDALSSMTASGPSRALLGQNGGVHLADMPSGVAAALREHACVYLDGSVGGLHAQLSALPRLMEESSAGALLPQEPLPVPANLSPAFLNGCGGFLPDGAYAILHQPPLPWCNLLSNAQGFGALVTDQGPLCAFYQNSRMSRLTPFPSDPVRPLSGQGLWLRDESSRCFVSLYPAQQTVHGFGWSRYESAGLGIRASITVFVDAGENVQCSLISLENPGDSPRTLSVTAAARFFLGADMLDSQGVFCHVNRGCVLAERPGFSGFAYLAFAGRTVKASCDASAFLGSGGMEDPRGMHLDALEGDGRGEAFGALRTTVALSGGEKETLCLLFGVTETAGNLPSILPRWAAGGAQVRLNHCRSVWDSFFTRLDIQTPERELNLLLGRWLPYQALSSRVRARAGFYQAGGAIGFRDQLQDMLAFLHTDPDMVRRHLINAAAHQFEAGDVLHWWHPPFQGVRTRIVDDRLFLPYVAAAYIRVTGDRSILEEPVRYLQSVEIPEGHEDWHGNAQPGPLEEPFHLHCLRAIDSIQLGEHGLPLMGAGDWNDGMNAVGAQGRGESVWMAFFLSQVLSLYAPLCAEEESERLLQKRQQLLNSAEEHAWDGRWYRRAWFDDGAPLGSQESPECQIDLLVQVWAVLSGASRGREALYAALERLKDENHGILRLLDPAFDGATHPGYIRSYPPGIRENGGQYTHAAVWALQALCVLGETEEAWNLLKMLLPTSHTADAESVLAYKAEPYVIAADISSGENAGRAGWSWYTGSAALLYQVMLEYLLGFEKQGNQVRLHPNVPGNWKAFSISYAYGASTYVLRAQAKKTRDPGWITLEDDGKTHEIFYPLPQS